MIPPDDQPSDQHAPEIAHALAIVRRNIPAGDNRAILAALDTLAQVADATALAEVEAWLGGHSLWESYGDRDDDPPDWRLDRQGVAALVRWRERLGPLEVRGAQLVGDWLGHSRYFGWHGFGFFTPTAPALSAQVGPLRSAEPY